MSTFSGKIQEIPNISVDRFDEFNLDSEAYFLSHCHTDHMVGLNTWIFQNSLLTNNKYIYASVITCAILETQFPILKNNLKVLDIYEPTIIQLKNGIISVSLISAGHCPGSVMFLFETNVRILYTGDYRINKNDIRKINVYDSFKQVKEIEKVYLDTTFFLKSYLKFPKRKESLDEICKIIKEWTFKGKNYIIKLSTSARYGYEYVFNEIYKETGMPVHVNKEAFEFYSAIPEMDKSVTLDGTITQIHCSCGSSYQYICYEAFNSQVRTIKISAFRWTQDNLEDGYSANSSENHYVCYSTHASYEEGVELLRFLKPKSVEICVKHDDRETNLEIAKLIEEVLDEWRPKQETAFKHKLFEVGDSDKRTYVLEEESSNCDFSVLDSPPRNAVWKSKKVRTEVNTKISGGSDGQRNSQSVNRVKLNSVEMLSIEKDNSDWVDATKLNMELESTLNSDAPPKKK